LLAAACAGISVGIARAATLETFQVGNWQAAALSDDQSGAFARCSMSANYSTGYTLLFSIDGNFTWSVGVLNTGWHLSPSSTYDVSYSINGGMPFYGNGTAVSGTEIEIPVPPDEGLYNRFRSGSQITISVMGQQLFFTLQGTQRGLAALLDCAHRHTAATAGVAPTGAPPGGFAPAAPGTPPATPIPPTSSTSLPPAPGAPAPLAPAPMPAAAPAATKGLTVDGVALMANVLAQSGLSDYHIAQTSEVPPQLAAYQAVWTAPNLTGFLWVQAAAGNASGDLIARDAKACSGNFSSGTLADDKQAAVNAGAIRVFTSCDGGSGAAVTYYTVLTKAGGGQYIFAEIGAAGSQNAAQDAEAKIRQAAGTIIQ